MQEVVDRLTALERRVAALERAPAAPPPATPDPDTFWALQGLRQREPGGAVLLTGSVETAAGERYEWQEAARGVDLLDGDWAERAPVLAALGSPVRLRLLHAVLGGVRTTTELAALDGMGTSGQLHHHLRELVHAGWLRSTARGRYEIPPARVVPLLAVLLGSTR